MKMFYRILADLTSLTHLAFILFVVLGAVLVVRWPKLMWLHLPAAAWGVLIEFAGWYCPLTDVENFFLHRAGEAGYKGGFVSHYILSMIYPHGLKRGLEIAIGAFVLVVNAALYVRVFRK